MHPPQAVDCHLGSGTHVGPEAVSQSCRQRAGDVDRTDDTWHVRIDRHELTGERLEDVSVRPRRMHDETLRRRPQRSRQQMVCRVDDDGEHGHRIVRCRRRGVQPLGDTEHQAIAMPRGGVPHEENSILPKCIRRVRRHLGDALLHHAARGVW